MKKLYKALLMVAALTFGATSCSDAPLGAGDDTQLPEYPSTESYELTLNVGLGEETAARAVFGDDNLTMTWESGDALGLFIHDPLLDEEGKHIANNAKMEYTGVAGNFSGVIPHDPANADRHSWYMFAYYPYNTAAGERGKYDADSWTINHASRQVQIDANHSNYDNYAFFSSDDFIEWEPGDATPDEQITLHDRTAALRFLVKADSETASRFVHGEGENQTIENLEEAVIYVVNSLPSNLETLSRADGVTPLSGHFKFDHTNGTYTAVDGETVNYIEVDFLAPSTRNNNFEINITTNNDTYVWAVVPPFTLDADQYLVAEFHTASYKVVYTYGGKDVEFKGNNTYNFKNVTATSSNTFHDVPQVHTNSYILGASALDATTGKRYPTTATLTMEVDLPISGNLSEHSQKYYIRYGYCNNCNHGGLETPWTDAVAKNVQWAYNVDEKIHNDKYLATVYTEDKEGESVRPDQYRVEASLFVDDVDALKAAFAQGKEPVFQAYVVCQNTYKVYYGEVVHVDLEPELQNFESSSFPLVLASNNGSQFSLNIPNSYLCYGNVNHDPWWINTIPSLRVYRTDISSQVNANGSLKQSTLELAVLAALEDDENLKSVQLPILQNLPSGYEGYYVDMSNPTGYIRYRMSNGTEYNLAENNMDDYNGAYRYVMQAYDAATMQLVWIRSEYFRLIDVKSNN